MDRYSGGLRYGVAMGVLVLAMTASQAGAQQQQPSQAADGPVVLDTITVQGESIAGALEMMPNIPAEVPSYWSVYFKVDDVDATFKKGIGLGATEMVAPQDYPGGRFAILSDPQGAMFALYQGAGF